MWPQFTDFEQKHHQQNGRNFNGAEQEEVQVSESEFEQRIVVHPLRCTAQHLLISYILHAQSVRWPTRVG